MSFSVYRASSAQKRIFLLQQLQGESVAYHLPQAWFIEGKLDKKRLQNALKELILRHESLRTSFNMKDGVVFQVVYNEIDIPFTVLPEANVPVEQLLNEFIRPFDLSHPPLWRLIYIENEQDKHILFLDIHHIISDGTSIGIFIHDFMSLYTGHQLPEFDYQYVDFTLWQNRMFEDPLFFRQENFWLNIFEGELPLLNFPLDFPRSSSHDNDGNTISFDIDKEGTRRLKQLTTQYHTTLYVILLGMFNILLSRYTGQEDIITATPLAGRSHEEFRNIIGMFINTLVIRDYPIREMTFEEYIDSLSSHVFEAFDNQDYPFERLVEKLNPQREFNRNPLSDVMFALQNFEHPIEIPGGFTITPAFGNTKTAKFDLLLTAYEDDQRVLFDLNYRSRLFKEETILRFISHLKAIISNVSENPRLHLFEIDLLDEQEKRLLLDEFNRTYTEFPTDKTIHGLFEEQVEKTPQKIAVVLDSTQLTYRELNECSNEITCVIFGKGVEPDSIIGIKIERSIEMLILILGILKSGCAYLPIDPSLPRDRIDYMLKDSGAILHLTTDKHSCTLIEKGDSQVKNCEGRIVKCEGETDTDTLINPKPKTQNSKLECAPAHTSYIIYTSGSTGKPKGVMVDHSSVINLLFAMQQMYPIEIHDSYLMKTAYNFDVSVTELFGWFIGGGSLVLLEKGGEKEPVSIFYCILKHHITHINFVPSMLNVFLDSLDKKEVERISSLKYVMVAGEALPLESVKKFRESGIQARLENLYGPTEATVYASRFSLENWEEGTHIPIGKPLSNTSFYIVDPHFQLQPIGVIGELCISGSGLASGYLNRPQMTAERFIPVSEINVYGFGMGKACLSSAFRTCSGEQHFASTEDATKSDSNNPITFHSSHFTLHTLYKTGDLARWVSDGNVEYMGRIDHQVKIRGFRIEPGEIESCLNLNRKVKNALVITRGDPAGNPYLCAYIVPVLQGEVIEPAELSDFLLTSLPVYMVPSHFVMIDKIPLNSNGKVNRKALPVPSLTVTSDFVAPRNFIEESLAEIWAEVMGIKKESIGIDHDFFQLGGHSLKASIINTKIRKRLNVDISLGYLFKVPTIRGISSLIQVLNNPKAPEQEPHGLEDLKLDDMEELVL